MLDKKLTDKEIVKALECCVIDQNCSKCPHYNHGKQTRECLEVSIEGAIDLINRLQEENERLKRLIEDKGGFILIKQAKTEAYKECIEKVKEGKEILLVGESGKHYRITDKQLDNLLKELVGEDDA